MNNERYNQIIDEVYNDYKKTTPEQYVVGSDSDPMKQSMIWKRKTDSLSGYPILERLSQEEFINKIKTDSEFSEKWGLKIEERELNWEERHKLYVERCLASGNGLSGSAGPDGRNYEFYENLFAKYYVPTKLITITYKNETIKNL